MSGERKCADCPFFQDGVCKNPGNLTLQGYPKKEEDYLCTLGNPRHNPDPKSTEFATPTSGLRTRLRLLGIVH